MQQHLAIHVYVPELECHGVSDISTWQMKLLFLTFAIKFHAQARLVSSRFDFHKQWIRKPCSNHKQWQENNLQVQYTSKLCTWYTKKYNNNEFEGRCYKCY